MTTGDMELGAHMEFAPNRKPDLEKYTTHSDVLRLSDPDVMLFGPFDFEDAPPGDHGIVFRSRRGINSGMPCRVAALLPLC